MHAHKIRQMFLASLPTHRPALVDAPLLQPAHNTNSLKWTEVSGASHGAESGVKRLPVRSALLIRGVTSDVSTTLEYHSGDSQRTGPNRNAVPPLPSFLHRLGNVGSSDVFGQNDSTGAGVHLPAGKRHLSIHIKILWNNLYEYISYPDGLVKVQT